jgi:cellobiose phosphorylase
MRYGHFDSDHREYIVDRPDTPRPWTNYSGNKNYNTIITANAGGYSYYRSSAYGRILRQDFKGVPLDCPGRYFYLRDAQSGDYWSASWQPVAKPLERYQTRTRFGTQYTVIESSYGGIRTEATYFVPLEQEFEYWVLSVKNEGSEPRTLDVSSYCEFTNQWNIFADLFDLQYSVFIVRAEAQGNVLVCQYHENMPPQHDSVIGPVPCASFMALAGAEATGSDGDREEFIGPHRGYHNPVAVERGRAGNSKAYGNNACGSLSFRLTLAPGEEREVVVLVGVGKRKDAESILEEYGSVARAKQELSRLKAHWHALVGKLEVETPDPEFDHMLNVWNPYCALMNFFFSRSASLIYTGDQRDGLGYRDSVQDILGIAHLVPELARERLLLMVSGQEASGAARPEIKPFSHKPGEMPATPIDRIRSDDCYWLFNSIPAYVDETGDLGFYDVVVPYSDKGEDTVFGHLRRALEFTLANVGAHGLPCGLLADWNDSIRLGQKGETVFVAFQLRLGLDVYARVAAELERPAEAAWARKELERVDTLIQAHTWDGEWFVRGFRENGDVIGSTASEEGRVWLNPQCWAVMSGAAKNDQARLAMDAVKEHLSSDYGCMICTPPLIKTDPTEIRSVVFLPGFKENAGIYNHNQGWAVIAEALLGRGDQAYRYYRAAMPSAHNDRIEIRKSEPYVHCQTTATRHSSCEGESNVAWLSGTASWMSYSATHYVLGIRPQSNGLLIDPCVPANWPAFTVRRELRGKRITVRVENPKGCQKGVAKVSVAGRELAGGFVPEELLSDGCEITAVMG